MQKRGFTLIELMIVIAIISVLVTIIMPKMSKSRDKAKLAACLTNLKHIGVALEIYANENKQLYPASSDIGNWLCVSDSTIGPFSQKYLGQTPICPAGVNTGWGNYVYLCPSPYNTYYVYHGEYQTNADAHAILGLPTHYPGMSNGKVSER